MISENTLLCQINVCKKIIKAIKAGEYHEASVLIRYYLNDKSYVWYKNVEFIIENQISNLFIDIETNFKKNYTINFFEGIIQEIEYEIKTGNLYNY